MNRSYPLTVFKEKMALEMLDRQLNNPPLLVAINRAHHEELIRRTERGQLLDKTRSDRLPLVDHILMVAGGILIAIGEKLQERCI